MKRIIKEHNGLHQYVRRSIQVCGQHEAFIPIKRRDLKMVQTLIHKKSEMCKHGCSNHLMHAQSRTFKNFTPKVNHKHSITQPSLTYVYLFGL